MFNHMEKPMFIKLYIYCLIMIITYMSIWFGIAHYKKNNSVADMAWGLGFICVAYFCLWYTRNVNIRTGIITFFITLWGARLFLHLKSRIWNKKEDKRYTELTQKWGNKLYAYSFIYIFMLQGFLLSIISIPIIFIATGPTVLLNVFDVCATGTWLFGFLFESISDYQLKQFLNNPNNHGRIMKTGLWKYTRHPNYFGETVMWWSIWIFTLALPGGWLTIISPILITYLLVFVSGVPLAEKQLSAHPDFQAYKNTTNVFFPWIPK